MNAQTQQEYKAWQAAILANEAVGAEIAQLNARIARNRKQWVADSLSEIRSEGRTLREQMRSNRHDD